MHSFFVPFILTGTYRGFAFHRAQKLRSLSSGRVSAAPDTGPGSIPLHRWMIVAWYASSASNFVPLIFGKDAISARSFPIDILPSTLKNELTFATSFCETSLPSNLHWQWVHFGWHMTVAQSLRPVCGSIMHWYCGSLTISTPKLNGSSPFNLLSALVLTEGGVKCFGCIIVGANAAPPPPDPRSSRQSHNGCAPPWTSSSAKPTASSVRVKMGGGRSG